MPSILAPGVNPSDESNGPELNEQHHQSYYAVNHISTVVRSGQQRLIMMACVVVEQETTTSLTTSLPRLATLYSFVGETVATLTLNPAG